MEKGATTRPTYTNPELISRIRALFRPYRRDVILTMVAVVVGVLLGLLPPLWLQIIIDDGITKGSLPVVSLYSALTIVITLVAALVTVLYGYLSVVVGQKIMCDLRRKLFVHLQAMPLKFFTSTRTGDIQTRLISDVQGVQTVLCTTLVDVISNFAIVVSCIIAMIIVDWRLTILSVAMIPMFGLLGKSVGNFARDVRTGVQEKTSDLNSMMQETLSVSGILLTKTTGRLDVLNAKFDEDNRLLATWQIKQQILTYLFFGMIRLITSLAPALVYWLAGYLMFRGDPTMTAGKIVAFTALQIRLFFPITGLLSSQVELISSLALFDRIFQYLGLPREIEDSPNAVPLHRESVQGEVEMRGVHFRYDDDGPWTLEDISFTAKPGQLVALVGPSGAGKTTLTYLIPRLYDATKGSVCIDGIDVKDLKMESIHEIVGAVTQETYLLHATIAENLRVAKPEATQDEMELACRMAAIHDHISSLEHGYETVVGERGYKLSGGEKQRIAIARAILKNPRILILDEATSSLDTRSERLIQESLKRLMHGRTTFAIAHRLSTILDADQILVVKRGRIVERGRHAELLVLDGVYAQLYHEQFESRSRQLRDLEEQAAPQPGT